MDTLHYILNIAYNYKIYFIFKHTMTQYIKKIIHLLYYKISLNKFQEIGII